MPNWSIYLTPGAFERELGLFCLGAGEQTHGATPAPERALGCHALVWLKEGRGHLLHGPDRQLYEVRAPALLTLFPGVLHGYRPATRWRQAWTLFSGPATDALTALGQLDVNQPVRQYSDSRPLDRAFAKLLRLSGQHNPVQLTGALYDLIGEAGTTPADGVAVQLAELACTPMSIQDYARALGLTVRELREAVRRTTGSTPQELILSTRLSYAKVLLAEEDLSVATVARRVGYDDPAYFSRLFATRVGMSPVAFRRSGSLSGPISSL
ncbi:helix-turn-helix domain-containing protein [Kribbella hippodromi]|uniref:Helix-turn-helix domain-containing protein n=1 Tax=Kribbella hippodromi TaxID=434347 RepID=A0ABN2D8S1_9ACTN